MEQEGLKVVKYRLQRNGETREVWAGGLSAAQRQRDLWLPGAVIFLHRPTDGQLVKVRE